LSSFRAERSARRNADYARVPRGRVSWPYERLESPAELVSGWRTCARCCQVRASLFGPSYPCDPLYVEGRGCLICGRRIPHLSVTIIGLFCADCLPTDGRYEMRLTGTVPCEVRELRVSSTRSDLGPYGTEAQPREIPFKLGPSVFEFEVRPHEKYVLIAIPVAPQFQVRGRGPGKGHDIEASLTLRWWYHDRQQFEDRLVYIDRAADKYLEVQTRNQTSEITWLEAESLTKHHAGKTRVWSKDPLPDWVTLPLGSVRVHENAPPVRFSGGAELTGSNLTVKIRYVRINMTDEP